MWSSKGEVLARLSRDLLEAQLAQNPAAIARAEAAIAQAGSNIIQAEAAQLEAPQALERARSLMKGGNTTEAVLEQRVSRAARRGGAARGRARWLAAWREAERRSAEAQGREIEVRLARTEIKAPQAGIVSRKNARIGATAICRRRAAVPHHRERRDRARGRGHRDAARADPRRRAPQVTIDARPRRRRPVRNVFPEVDRATRLGQGAHRSAEGRGLAHRRVRARHGRARAAHRRRRAARRPSSTTRKGATRAGRRRRQGPDPPCPHRACRRKASSRSRRA